MLASKEVDGAISAYLISAKKFIDGLVDNEAVKISLKNSVDLCVGPSSLEGRLC